MYSNFTVQHLEIKNWNSQVEQCTTQDENQSAATDLMVIGDCCLTISVSISISMMMMMSLIIVSSHIPHWIIVGILDSNQYLGRRRRSSRAWRMQSLQGGGTSQSCRPQSPPLQPDSHLPPSFAANVSLMSATTVGTSLSSTTSVYE